MRSKSRKQVRPKFYFYSGWMGTKMEIGGEAMHLRSRDPWYEAHAALCAKRRPPLATPPLLEIANVKLATLSHWQHSQPPALRQSKSRYLTNRSITPLNFTLFLRYHPRSSRSYHRILQNAVVTNIMKTCCIFYYFIFTRKKNGHD